MRSRVAHCERNGAIAVVRPLRDCHGIATLRVSEVLSVGVCPGAVRGFAANALSQAGGAPLSPPPWCSNEDVEGPYEGLAEEADARGPAFLPAARTGIR